MIKFTTISFFTIISWYAQGQTITYEKVDGRRLAIYLPEGYAEDTAATYKTVYFYDGQVSFTNSPFSWQLQNEITELIEAGKIEKIIGVGIYTDVNRTEDLVPFYDPHVEKDWGAYKPRGNKFSEFIITQIVPFIENNYRARKDSSSRALIGMSFAGLHALYTGITYPDAFGFVAGISPSLWVDNYHIFREMKKAVKGPVVWIDIGTGEWNNYLPAVSELEKSGYTYGQDLFYYEQPGATHDHKFWKERVKYPLMIFAGFKNEEIDKIELYTEVIRKENSKKYIYKLNPVLTLKNGVTYSLTTSATYKLINTNAGVVNNDGSFEFKGKDDLQVEVSYKGWKQNENISISEIKSKMKD